jgi:hypothetical protein
MIWSAGGSAAIVLKDPKNSETKQKVSELLLRLAGDKANGIDRILPEAELRSRGGFPDAAFLVALRPDFVIGENVSGDLVTAAKPEACTATGRTSRQ